MYEDRFKFKTGKIEGRQTLSEALSAVNEEKRIPKTRKGQDPDTHSDLYTDEDPKDTIHGLGFKNEAKAKESVAKIKKSGRKHAHKIQAAIAMEQRARAADKDSAAAVYRRYIEQMKKKTKLKEELDFNPFVPDPPEKRMNELADQRKKEANKILALHQDEHGIPYTPNSGMHFAMHFGEHPKFGKLYIGNGNTITNNPKKARKTSPMDSSGLWKNAGRSGMAPLQPLFRINGRTMAKGHVLHPELKEYIKGEKLRAEPRLTFSLETTKEFANKWHADQAEAKIKNQRQTIKVTGGKNRAKLRQMEKEEEGGLEEGWSSKYKKSIDCDNPKGFSQKAHCKGRQKNFKSFSEEMNLRESIKNMAMTAIAATAPAHAEHTVKRGDTLSAMARKHNISVADLAKHNKIEDPNKITIGQLIKFPGSKKEESKAETPTKKAPTPETPKAPDNCPYGELCLALQRAETGSEKDPFIRTRHRPKGGSTAFGPGQITGQTLRDFNTRYPKEFSEVGDYMKTLIDQSRQFAKYGAEPKKAGYEARFDYGGSGDPKAKDAKKYDVVQRGVLRGMANDIFGEIPSQLSKEQREKLVTRYRGVDRAKDPRYFKEVDRTYNK